jgi:hypothetical protein
VFTTNWNIYKACFPTLLENSERGFIIEVLKLQKLLDDENALKVSGLKKKGFNRLFLEAVDETLNSLGETCKQAIYSHLTNNFKIKIEEIPNQIEKFEKAIESIFGFGAKIIEIQIMKRLYQKTGEFKYYPKDENLTFTKYANAIKILNHALNTK